MEVCSGLVMVCVASGLSSFELWFVMGSLWFVMVCAGGVFG